MKTIYELIKYSDHECDKRTENLRGDLYELLDDAKRQMNLNVEAFLEVAKNFVDDMSNYKVIRRSSMEVEIVYRDPEDGTQRIHLGYQIRHRQMF